MKEFLIALISASLGLSYLIGSQYLFGYYDYFGIALAELDYSIERVAIAAVAPISSNLDKLLIAASAFTIILLLYHVATSNRYSIAIWKTGILLMSVIFFVSVLFDASEQGAKRAKIAVADLPQFYRITSGDPPLEDYNLNDVLLRLVVATKDTYFLYGDIGSGRENWILRIPRDGTFVGGSFYQ